jgi:hypothetical protein
MMISTTLVVMVLEDAKKTQDNEHSLLSWFHKDLQ